MYTQTARTTGSIDEDLNIPHAYYLQDDLGSPVRLLDGDGTVKETYGYDEFGQDLYQNQRNFQPFGYTGYQIDNIAGTCHAQAREYRPEAGRFMSADIVKGFTQIPLTMNSYAYSFSAPLDYVDLDGLWPKIPNWGKIAIGVGAIAIGVAVTVATGGAAAPAVVAGLKAAAIAGGVSAGISGSVTAVKSVTSGDDLNTTLKKTAKSAIDGFADGFMTGGIMAGASQVVSGGFKVAAKMGVSTGRKGGIELSRDIKVLSPNNVKSTWDQGGTLVKIGNLFRIDVGHRTLLHVHFLSRTTEAMLIKAFPKIFEQTIKHFPLGTLASGLFAGINREIQNRNGGCEVD